MKKQHWTAVVLCHLLAFAPMSAADKAPAKESIECSVSRYYKYRPAQTAAREAFITYHGDVPSRRRSWK